MVYQQNTFSDFYYDVVQVDVSTPAHRPVVKSWVEISFAHKHVQFDIDDIGINYGLAFLKLLEGWKINIKTSL